MQLRSCQRISADSRPRAMLPGSAQPLRPAPSAAAAKGRRAVRYIPRAAGDASSTDGASSATSNPLDFEELTEIIRMVNSTDVVELELKSKRFSLSMRKKEAIAVPEPAQPQVQYLAAPPQQQHQPQQFAPPPQYQEQPQQQQQQQQPAQPQQQAAPAAPSAADGTELLSPMGGTYYRSPAPGEPPFVAEGDKVTKGQTVAIIEAMKLMNEIEAEVDGTVTALLVDNGSPVTPGQPLLVIKPN